MSEQKGSQKSRRNSQGTALEDENLEEIQGGVSGGSQELDDIAEKLKDVLPRSPVIQSTPE